ncbi:Uncharacterised protein [Klebsiella pneumoniae]|nr:Uncharacterised protein [Klebsiella pneumoniae]
MDLVLDAVQAGHQQRGEGQVGVGCRVREARFDTAGLRAGYVGDTDRGGTVARRVGQHHRSFEARDQALVGVGRGVGEAVQGLAVLDDAADEVQGGLGQAGIAFAGEGVLAVLGDRHVHVHARTVVAVQRLRHEGHGLAVGVGDVVHAVLQGLHFVGLGDQGVELHADLVLAGGCHFVVVDFDHQAHFFQGVAHGGADFMVVVDRRYREVAALHARAMALVAGLDVGVGVPGSLLGEDLEHRAGDVGLELHFVEDEELRLRADEHGVADAGGLQVLLGALGDVARVALVALHGARLDDVADQDQGRLFGERIEDGGAVVRHQDHVGGFDAFPAGDGGAVEHLAGFEELIVQRVASRHGDVLLLALGIGEAQVYPLHVMVFDQLVRLVRHAVLQEGLELGAFSVPQYRVMPAGILRQGNLPHK